MTESISSSLLKLAETLVLITRERGVSIEHLRAEQVLSEARQGWPGTLESMWFKWLSEGVKSLGLRCKVASLSLDEALHLVEDGALLVSNASTGERFEPILLGCHKTAAGENSEGDPSGMFAGDPANPRAAMESAADDPGEILYRWLIIEDLELSHEHAAIFHHRPIARLFSLVRPEWSDIWVVAVFAFFAGILSLATPIAVESLVNMVTFGRLLQPLLVLSLMLFAFLAFAAMMKGLQAFVVEIIQRRLFTRVAADLAYRLPRVKQSSLEGRYGPELANRFFDVVTVQKVVALLLLDGIAIALATLIGMAVLAFYHPWLLGFDILLLILVVGGILVLGRGAIATGIEESKQKYRLASWLEDVLRCPVGFKASGAAEYSLDRANEVTAAYLDSRRRHFAVLFRQLLFILGLQAVAGTVLLGFGGWLVIRGQLTLGQLVAAELIVATILGSLAKLGKHIESFYDVVASVDKLGYLFDLEMEPQDGLMDFRPASGTRVRVTGVQHKAGGAWLAGGLSLGIDQGERVALLSEKNAGASVLFDLLYGLRFPDAGHIEIEHADPRDLRPDVLRRSVTLVRGIEIFEGSIAENVHLGRAGISTTDIRAALHTVGLLDGILELPDGLEARVNASGSPLLVTQRALLMLARAIAGQPKLLLIDGILDSLGDTQLACVCESLRDEAHDWTLLVATNQAAVARYFGRIIDVDSGQDSPVPLLPAPETLL